MLYEHEILELVTESNKIEGIHRDPTRAELVEFKRFVELDHMCISELVQFVSVFQPDAVLRTYQGRNNVRVGGYYPPASGPYIYNKLYEITTNANASANGFYARATPYSNHIDYELLHPFSDGNGRSGRALWCWHHHNLGNKRFRVLGFLHTFYYETLTYA